MNKKQPVVTTPVVNLERYEEFKVKISQLVPFDLNFGNMTLTEYELLVMTIYRLNELIGIVNMYSTTIDEVLEWVIGDGLQESVLMQLNAWLVDGTLEDLINEALFNGKVDKIEFEEFKVAYENEISKIREDISNNDSEIINLNNVKLDKVIFEAFKNSNELELNNIKNTINKNFEPLENIRAINFMYGHDGKGINFMHRGLSAFFPENSNMAFDVAGLVGAKGIELDLWNTNDGVFVVSHDNELISMTDQTGYIQTSSWEYVKEQKITKGNNIAKFNVGNMISISSALFVAQRYGMNVLAEIKPKSVPDNVILGLINQIRDRGMLDSVLIMSYHREVVEQLRRLDDEVLIGLVVSSESANESTFQYLSDLKNAAISINYTNGQNVDRQVALSETYKIPHTFWTIDDMSVTQNILALGCKSVTSNFIRGNTPFMVEKSFAINLVKTTASIDYRFGHDLGWVYYDGEDLVLSYGVPFTVNTSDTDWRNERRGIATLSTSAVAENVVFKAHTERAGYIYISAFKDGVKVNINTVTAYFSIKISGLDFK